MEGMKREIICPFEKICGAGIVRELRGKDEDKGWQERFCRDENNYKNCVHFELRNKEVEESKLSSPPQLSLGRIRRVQILPSDSSKLLGKPKSFLFPEILLKLR